MGKSINHPIFMGKTFQTKIKLLDLNLKEYDKQKSPIELMINMTSKRKLFNESRKIGIK